MATLTRLTYFFSSTPLATIGANSTVKHQLKEGRVSDDQFIAADAPVEHTAAALKLRWRSLVGLVIRESSVRGEGQCH